MRWERKFLIKIYGPTYEKGSWKIRKNEEIYNKFKFLYIVSVINPYRTNVENRVSS